MTEINCFAEVGDTDDGSLDSMLENSDSIPF